MKYSSFLKLTAAFFIIIFVQLHCTGDPKQVKLEFKYMPGMILNLSQETYKTVQIYNEDSVFTEKTDDLLYEIEVTIDSIKSDSIYCISEVITSTIHRNDNMEKPDSCDIDYSIQYDFMSNGKISNVTSATAKNSDYLNDFYEQNSPVFPEELVAPGYTWTQTGNIILQDSSIATSTTGFKVVSYVRESGYDCLVIEYAGDLVIPIFPNPSDSTNLSGIDRIKSKGVLYFAYNEGLIILSRDNWHINGDRQILEDNKIVNYSIKSDFSNRYWLNGIK